MSDFNEGNNGFMSSEPEFSGGEQPQQGTEPSFADNNAGFTGADPNFMDNVGADQGSVPPPDFSDNAPRFDPNMFADNDNIKTVDFVSSEPAPEKKQKPKKKKGKAILIIIAVILVLAVAAVFLAPFVFVKIGDSKMAEGDYEGAATFYGLSFGMYDSEKRMEAADAVLTLKNGDIEGGIKAALESGISVEVNHDLDGGHFSRDDRQINVTFESVDAFQTLGTVTKENYSFDGWLVNAVSYDPDFDDSHLKLNVKADFSVQEYDIVYSNIYDADNKANDPEADGIEKYNYETPTITLKNPTRVGYTFDGWSGTDINGLSSYVVIDQGSSGDRSYIANWTPNTYSVTFVPDVELKFDNPATVTYDKTFRLPYDAPYDASVADANDPYKKNPVNNEISKPGYRLTYWKEQSGSISEKFTEGIWSHTTDVILVPVWEIITYDLAYKLEGGEAGTQYPANYTVESPVISITDPSRFGYTFLGWTFEGQAQPKASYVIPARSTRDYTFTANWIGNPHKITLDLAGGTASASVVNVRFGSEYTIPTPSRVGYTFKGWTGNDVPATSGTWNRDYDSRITAKWQANKYKITFNANGGSVGQSSMDIIFDDYAPLPTPTRKGYTFKGWYQWDNLFVSGTWKTANNVDLTAVWSANSYTLSYNANGGKISPSSKTVTYDKPYSLDTPTRKGYSFQGWYDGSQKMANGTWTRDGGLTITAKWDANTYKYTLDAEGGYVSSRSGSVKYDSSYSLPTPTREGYDFVGWYDGKTKIPSSGKWEWDENMTLSAKWEGKEYTVSLDANGGKVSSTKKTVVYGESYKLPTPTREGYNFVGWYSGSTKISTSGTWKRTSDTYVEAKWELIETKVELDANGGYVSRDSYTFTYGYSYSLPTPTRSGYNFLGWYDGSKKVASSGTWTYEDDDMTLKAKWEAIPVVTDPSIYW